MLSVGYFNGKPSKARALAGLFNPRIPNDAAVRRAIESCQRKQRPYLATLTDTVHHAVFCPTGGGKTQGIVLPHASTCFNSMAIFDPKGEIHNATASIRKAAGHDVYILDPYHQVTDTPDTLNPLDFIDPKHLIADCREIGNALIKKDPGDQSPHWAESAEILASVMTIGVAAFASPEKRNLQRVREMLSSTEAMNAGIDNLARCGDPHLVTIANQARNYQNKEALSVLTTLNRNLSFLDEPEIKAATLKSTFDPAKLRDGNMTVYIVIPLNRLDTQINYLRLMFGSMLRACVREGFDKQNEVDFIIDEAGAFGPMKQIDSALDKYRGNMVRMHLFYQSMGQLKSCFPVDGGQTMLSNTSQIFMATKDYATAEAVSNMGGSGTIITQSGGVSEGGSEQQPQQGGGGSSSTSWNKTSNWSPHERKLLRPEEVLTLNKRVAITFVAGLPPIRTWLAYHYENNYAPRRMPKWRVAIDTACLFLTAAFLAALWTGIFLNQR